MQCLLKGPPDPNTDNRRLLNAENSEVDSVRRRFLEKLAGPDIVEPQYHNAPLPLKIPTRHLNPL